jgi:hypothetical protein
MPPRDDDLVRSPKLDRRTLVPRIPSSSFARPFLGRRHPLPFRLVVVPGSAPRWRPTNQVSNAGTASRYLRRTARGDSARRRRHLDAQLLLLSRGLRVQAQFWTAVAVAATRRPPTTSTLLPTAFQTSRPLRPRAQPRDKGPHWMLLATLSRPPRSISSRPRSPLRRHFPVRPQTHLHSLGLRTSTAQDRRRTLPRNPRRTPPPPSRRYRAATVEPTLPGPVDRSSQTTTSASPT